MYHFIMDGPKSEKQRLVIAGGSDPWSDEPPSEAGAGGRSLMSVEVGKMLLLSLRPLRGVGSTASVVEMARETVGMVFTCGPSCGVSTATVAAFGGFWGPGAVPGFCTWRVPGSPEQMSVFSL